MSSTSHKSGHLSETPAVRQFDTPSIWMAYSLVVIVVLTLPLILVLVVQALPEPPKPAWSAEAVSLGVSPLAISKGDSVYHMSCSLCHGDDGKGMHLLGKPVRNSAFVQAASDAELMRLLVEGRAINDPLNTSGALMPPRGAQNLSDSKLSDIILYLRAIQDPSAPTASTEAWNLKGTGGEPAKAAVELTDHKGFDLFVASCAACHGQGAEGMDELGLPLSTSGFIRGLSDKDLITFIKSGRPIWDELNTTGLDMPPKGGNPAVTDEQLQTIVDYLRAVQEETMGS